MRICIYALCVVLGFTVIVAMAVVSTCEVRDDSQVAYVQLGELRLEYVSERIMAMKRCKDTRALLPPALLVIYIGILLLFMETQLSWQQESDVPAVDSFLYWLQTWSGLLLLSISAIGLSMIIVFDHTGGHRQWHGVGVLMMLLGLLGVYLFTLVHESICNLGMHPERHTRTTARVLTITHILIVFMFIVCIVLFVVAWHQEWLAVAVLCEYILLLIILVLSVISIVELSVMQNTGPYKASAVPLTNAEAQDPPRALPRTASVL